MKRTNEQIDYSKLILVFNELAEEQQIIADKYENNDGWAMAYLCRWIILEKTLKALYGARVKISLHGQIDQWTNYLNGELKKAPPKITNFSVNPITIPGIKNIKKELGRIPYIEKVMSSDAKWRKKRNAIAHSTEEFGRRSTYFEYKQDLDAAIEELRRRLQSKIA